MSVKVHARHFAAKGLLVLAAVLVLPVGNVHGGQGKQKKAIEIATVVSYLDPASLTLWKHDGKGGGFVPILFGPRIAV